MDSPSASSSLARRASSGSRRPSRRVRKVDRALARNRHEEAWQRLAQHLATAPGDRDAALVYWQLAKDLDRAAHAAPVLLRVIREEIHAGDRRNAVGHWIDLRAHVLSVVADLDLMARIAAALADDGADGETEDLIREAIARVDASTPVATLLKLARAAKLVDDELAAATRALVLAHPSLPLGIRLDYTNATSACSATPRLGVATASWGSAPRHPARS